jgi:ubiquitin C-terminal hydrolase
METVLGVCRFNNIDNVTCYMNSILAIIQQMPLFADYLLTIKNDEPITYQLSKLIYMSHIRDDMLLTPTSFRKEISIKNSMWGMREHQDSQEFFSFLLCSIEEEIKKTVVFVPGRKFNIDFCKQNVSVADRVGVCNYNQRFNASIYPENKITHKINVYNTIQNIHKNIIKQNNFMEEYSIIKKLFNGMVHNIIKCNYCNNISHKYESFFTLQLNVHDTIYDSMDDFIKNEQMDKDNMKVCDFCGMKNQAHKETIISSMPEILVIHLKRFMVNNYGIVTRKISSMVKYPVELNITIYGEGEIGEYKLFGVNMHHSIGHKNNADRGHYTSIVINRNNNKWYHYDDAKEIEEIYDYEHKNAYMLFYYKN